MTTLVRLSEPEVPESTGETVDCERIANKTVGLSKQRIIAVAVCG